MRKMLAIILCVVMTALLMSSCGKSKSGERPALEEAKIGAMTGTMGDVFVSENYPDAQLKRFDSINDAFMALQSGKLDYVITAKTTATNFIRKNSDLELYGEELRDEEVAIAVGKEDTELLRKIDDILLEFENDGTLDKVISNWIVEPDEDYVVEDIEKSDSDKVLRVAIAANREPMCFVQDNKFRGLDIELIERIAYKLDMTVEYQDMNFSSLIVALQSGTCDVVISNLSATDERKEKVNFSRIYFHNPEVFVVKK